jgi:cytohesin
LKHQADINAKDKDGRSPLHVAAIKLDISICRLLIKSGANKNDRDKEPRTPIDLAIGKIVTMEELT